MKLLDFSHTVFIDRSFGGYRLAAILRKVGFDVRVHKEHFNSDADDDCWIPDVANRGWIILSSDKRISKDPVNIRAVVDSKARVIMSTDNNNIPEFFGSAFIVGHRKVREFLEHNPGPVFIQVSPCTGDHVRVVKQHLTHPHVAKMQEREAEPLPFSTFLKF